MSRHWLMLSAVLCLGCDQASSSGIEMEQPARAGADFDRLPALLAGIRAGEVLLHEGLPSEFWEPQAWERELRQKKTLTLQGYPVYEELLALQPPDAGHLTTLFSARDSFKPLSLQKKCGDFHVDYCVEWKTGAATYAFVCLECGDVMLFSPEGELHCDFTDDAAQKLKFLLSLYQKNRPVAQPTLRRPKK